MYVKRTLSAVFKRSLDIMPAVMITGPRQSGKTTFLKHEIRDNVQYISFDDPLQRSFALEDPVGFLNQWVHKHIILDEIQYVPELLQYLKMNIDMHRNVNGKWILTGSQQFSMMKDVSESLAGRVAIFNLFPFHTHEIPDKRSLEELLWTGGYPDMVLKEDIRNIWLPSYISTYIERDVRQLINIQDMNAFQTFISASASLHGQELNMAKMAKLTGMSQPTLKRWISILTSSFIVYLLKPYSRNFGKRLIKSPKLYFMDSAIVSYLTKHLSRETLLAGAMSGSFFEGFIIAETYKILKSLNTFSDIYFWRSHDGVEVDLILEKNDSITAIEIKKTSTVQKNHGKNLLKFQEYSKDKFVKKIIVSTVETTSRLPHDIVVLPWQNYFDWLENEY